MLAKFKSSSNVASLPDDGKSGNLDPIDSLVIRKALQDMSVNEVKKLAEHAKEKEIIHEQKLDEKLKNLKTEIDDEKKRIFNNSFSRFLIISPPSTFSDKNRLLDLNYSTVNNCFPKKFSGQDKYTIREFLSHCNKAQSQLNLSKQEFFDELKIRTTGQAFKLLENWSCENLPLEDLYYLLLSNFDDGMSPHQAERILNNYKIPANFSLKLLQSEISNLTNIASNIYSDPDVRLSHYNEQSISVLMRLLPSSAKKWAIDCLNEYYMNYGTKPSYNQFCKNLERYAVIIDEELNPASKENSKFGFSRKFMDFKIYAKKSFDKPNRFSGFNNRVSIKNIKVDNNKANGSGKLDPTKSSFVNKFKKNRDYDNVKKSSNQKRDLKLKCQLCNGNNHSASQICYAIADDNANRILITPSYEPCSRCKKLFNQDFLHPEKYCPARSKMQHFYKTGRIRPVGIYRKQFNSIYKSEMPENSQ